MAVVALLSLVAPLIVPRVLWERERLAQLHQNMRVLSAQSVAALKRLAFHLWLTLAAVLALRLSVAAAGTLLVWRKKV